MLSLRRSGQCGGHGFAVPGEGVDGARTMVGTLLGAGRRGLVPGDYRPKAGKALAIVTISTGVYRPLTRLPTMLPEASEEKLLALLPHRLRSA